MDAATGLVAWELPPHGEDVVAVQFGARGDLIAYGGGSNAVFVASTVDKRVKYRCAEDPDKKITDIALSCDGSQLAVSFRSHVDNLAEVFSLSLAQVDGAEVSDEAAEPAPLHPPILYQVERPAAPQAVSFSTDGKWLAVGGWDEMIAIVTADTCDHRSSQQRGSLHLELNQQSRIRTLVFAPNIQQKQQDSASPQTETVLLAVADNDKRICVYDINVIDAELDGSPVKEAFLYVIDRTDRMEALAFASDGLQLVAGGYDKRTAVFDALTGVIKFELDCHALVSGVALSKTGLLAAAIDGIGESDQVSAGEGEDVDNDAGVKVWADIGTEGVPVASIVLCPNNLRRVLNVNPMLLVSRKHGASNPKSLLWRSIKTENFKFIRALWDQPCAPSLICEKAFERAFSIRNEHIISLLLRGCALPQATIKTRELATRMIPQLIEEGFHAILANFFGSLELERAGPMFRAVENDGTPLASAIMGKSKSFDLGVPWSANINAEKGVLAIPLRVPLPNLASNATLDAFLDVDDEETRNVLWGSDCISTALEDLWLSDMYPVHKTTCRIFSLQLLFFSCRAAMLAKEDTNFGDDEKALYPNAVVSGIVDCALLFTAMHFMRRTYYAFMGSLEGTITLSAIWASEEFKIIKGVDLSGQFCAAIIAIAHPFHLLGWTALLNLATWAAVGLMVKCLLLLTGLETTAHLIQILTQNIVDMLPFLLVMLCILYFYALMFMLQFAPSPITDDLVSGFASDDSFGFGLLGGIPKAVINALAMSVLGLFSLGVIERGTADSDLAMIIFLGLICMITLIALNALIAILGGSFEQVNENAAANRNLGRAKLMLEHYHLMKVKKGEAFNKRTEESAKWAHCISSRFAAQLENEDEAVEDLVGSVKNLNGRIANVEDMMLRIVGNLDTLNQSVTGVVKKRSAVTVKKTSGHF